MAYSGNKLPKSWKQGFNVSKLAREHSNAEVPGKRLGSALFSGNKLLSTGFNTYGRTHVKSRDKEINLSIHAEMKALLKRRWYDNNNLIMYVYRELGTGKLGCSKPCPTCMKWLIEAGVCRVRFINEKGHFEEIKL